MCGRYSNTAKRSDEFHVRMAELLGAPPADGDTGFERFNIAPTQEAAAVVHDMRGARFEELRWGLAPAWAENSKQRFTMINARAETLLEKPAYRNLVERSSGRCLVLADGWYEWQKPEDPKQPRRPVRFSLRSGEPFCLAGLWTAGTFTIVTCEANELARPIHDRMPVALADPAAWQAWLDPRLDGPAATELLGPLAVDAMRVRPANPLVNSVDNDGPECLAEAPPAAAQIALL
jgi:putative SOS response-associated peptidase YedK